MKWEKRILHLGLGRFHRGHQAVYYQRMAEWGDSRWGVVSMSMRSPEARDHVRAVDLKYPVLELSEKHSSLIWINSIREALDAQEDFQEVLNHFLSPELEIITLTITEKGYCLTSQGGLDFNHTSIQNDVKNPAHPKSAIGLLALGLKKRSEAKAGALTILSCDNLRKNGGKLESALTGFLEKVQWHETAAWIKRNVSFPNTMVDRIVPFLTLEQATEFEKRFDLPAQSQIIATEKFSQWVIEDDFKKPRPEWNKVGVQFVKDVRPFEEMKLRLLNATHSYLAYAGTLRGHRFIHEAISDLELREKVEKLMLEEVAPLLEIPSGFDVKDYSQDLITRFRNNQLPHQLKQIAMDGSQKLPQRILPSLVEAHHRNQPHQVLTQAVAAWLNYCWKTLSEGEKLDDPLHTEFAVIGRHTKRDWLHQMLSTPPFASLENTRDLQQHILQVAENYS